MSERCVSCDRDVTSINNSVIFECPKCSERIVRCGECRKKSIKYACKCGFKGW